MSDLTYTVYMVKENTITFFAQTDSRNRKIPFGIKSHDRTKHMYVIGKTGMGKSTLLENMVVQDIQNGEGVAFIDPHGKSAELLLDYVPRERINDVLYFAPFDMEHPVSFNVMEDVGADKRHLVANGLMSAFKKIWVDAWSARMEYILNNILLALLEYPGSTLIGVNRMLADKDYRKKVVENITDPSVRSFWIDEFARYGDRYMQEAGAAIQNKIGQFISNPLVRNIIGQPKSTFDIRTLMDDRKILVINLSKGRVGEANANLLGSMIITKIYLAAMSRADVHDKVLQTLPNFYLYVDEFQSFANESFADILSEARKYKLNLTIAHQYIEQMSDEVRAAVFGNVGTMITFRVGAYDAEVLEKEFSPQFSAQDLVNLGFAQIYLKLMIDGISSHPFSATTLTPIAPPPESFKEKIITHSRETFARPRAEVEKEIRDWHQPESVTTEQRNQKREGGSGGNYHRGKTGVLPQKEEEKKREISNYQTPRSVMVPLDSLKKKNHQKGGEGHSKPLMNKNPSPKNMSALREALSRAMEKHEEDKKENQKLNPEKKEEAPESILKEREKEMRPFVPPRREIPEEALRKVLDVPKPEKQ